MEVKSISSYNEALALPKGELFVQWNYSPQSVSVWLVPVFSLFDNRDLRKAVRYVKKHAPDATFSTQAEIVAFAGNAGALKGYWYNFSFSDHDTGWKAAKYFTTEDPNPPAVDDIPDIPAA